MNTYRVALASVLGLMFSACGGGGGGGGTTPPAPSDTTPPDTAISSGPAAVGNLTGASFSFTSTESGSTFQCSLDAGVFAACTSPDNVNGLAEGAHNYQVRATDAAGNTDQSPATQDWTIDTTLPIVNAPAAIAIATIGAAVPVSDPAMQAFLGAATASDNLDGDLSGGISNDAPASFPLGVTTVTFSVSDMAGNSGSNTSTVTVNLLDSTPPDTAGIVVNSNAQYAVYLNSLSARLTASDNIGVTGYLITDHNVTDPMNVIPPYLDPLVSDSRWVAVTENSPVDLTVQFSLTQSYQLGDTVDLCAWFRDAQGNISTRVCDSIVFGVVWEDGIGNWSADNGVWQVGTPSVVGPASCYAGSQCAGTVLNGNYPVGTNSRLISTRIQLQTISGGEEIHLRFQQWFSYASGDTGQVQVSVWDSASSTFGPWISEGDTVANISGGWSLKDVDLTAYSGELIRIGFQHSADGVSTLSSGWYVDNIRVVRVAPTFSGDFETGWNGWGAGNGAWQVGAPTATGPANCFAGTQCVGTVLDGNYPVGTDSRLVGSSTQLPSVTGAAEIHLRFQQWFSYASGDSGQVQISVWNATTMTWGPWLTEGDVVRNLSGGWSLKDVDLTAYSGQLVRVGFLHSADGVSTVSSGWYIDDIAIVAATPSLSGNFELGWDNWGAGNGAWQVGAPSLSGPASCYSGSQCAGTVLSGNYPVGTDSRLIGASVQMPSLVGVDEIHLRFRQWFSYASGDSGQVQISVWDAPSSTWGTWTNEGTVVANISGGWSLKDVDLTNYSGELVRIAFFHSADGVSTVSSGWYIDEVSVVSVTPTFSGDFEAGWGDWGAGNGVWQVGTPSVTGPASCFAGALCAGTVLAGNYPVGTDSRLVSASLQLATATGTEEIHLRFQQWFSYASGDSGSVQVSVWDSTTAIWGSWTTEGTVITNSSGGWSLKDVDLTAYSGGLVRIGILHSADGVSTLSSGWYVDDITVSVF